MKNVWSKSGSSYKLAEVSHQHKDLPAGIYRLEFDQVFNFFFLDQVQESFAFPYKIYNVETEFVDRVKKSWDNTTGNMGVLLNGLKGTGKTVTAELICNKLALPVIIIQKHYEGLVSFLNSIQQDVIIFIDEYEKIYSKYESTLLSVMDGVFRTDSRKMFLLTTNDLNIDRNMLQRPSRVRYIKSYTDLTLDVIIEVVEDKLIHKHLKKQTIQMISELPIITMDLVKSVIEEVNIHEEDPALFKHIFNVQGDQSDIMNVYILEEDGTKTEYAKSVVVHPTYLNQYDEGEGLFIQRRRVGTITKFINKSQLLVEVETEDGEDKDRQIENKIMCFEPAVKMHNTFSSYAF